MTTVIFWSSPVVRLLLSIPFVIGSACALAACGAEPTPSMRAQEIRSEGGIPEAARGVWHNADYGWILEIDGTGITRWQDMPAGCYTTDQAGPTLMGQVEYRYFTLLDRDRAKFEYLPSDGNTVFVRLDALPDRCGARDLSDRHGTFDIFTSAFERHYAFFERRGVDWAERVAEARARLSEDMSDTDFFDLLAGLIEPLGDSHTKLIADFGGARHRAQYGLGQTLPMIFGGMGETPWLIGLIDQTLDEVLDPGARHIGNDRVIVGTIGQRIGYIQFFTMGGFTGTRSPGTPEWAEAELAALDEMLDSALTAFDGLDAVILDLSNNRGGYDAVTRAIASRFTDTAFTGYTVRTDWDETPEAVYEIAPHDGPRFTGPVYVLTSDVTVSAGEITTLMLRQLPNVTHAGATTRGAFSTPLAKPLPNGWYVELANEIFAAPDGTVHEGSGLEPDIALTVFDPEDPVASHGEALRALVARIGAAER
jgi:carboxyl-terminal processing protease